MDIEFTLCFMSGLLIVGIVYTLHGFLRKRTGKGTFTWRKALVSILSLEGMALAIGYFEPSVRSVASSTRMTYGMLGLIGLVTYSGFMFILTRLCQKKRRKDYRKMQKQSRGQHSKITEID